MFNSIIKKYKKSRQIAATRRELSNLSDRDLSDIGIGRSDINRIALEGWN